MKGDVSTMYSYSGRSIERALINWSNKRACFDFKNELKALMGHDITENSYNLKSDTTSIYPRRLLLD